MDNAQDTLKQLRRKLRTRENGPASDAMKALGINYKRNHGLSVKDIKDLALSYRGDNELALLLYGQDVREFRLMSYMILEHTEKNCNIIEKWLHELADTEQAEQFAINLLAETKHCLDKFEEFLKLDNEYSKRAVFVAMARIAMTKKDILHEDYYLKFIKLAEKCNSCDLVNVAKAVSWALRRIGRLNMQLRNKCIDTAKKIENKNCKYAKLIFDEVDFELNDEFIISMIPK